MNKYGGNKNVRNLRSGVNFIRNVAAPKLERNQQTHSSKFISTHYNHAANTSTLVIILNRHEGQSPRNLIFSFSSFTKIAELIAFLRKHTHQDLVYFNSGNLHIDYFLTLKNRYVKQLPCSKLSLVVKEIKEYPRASLNFFEIIKCIGSGGFSKVLLGKAYGIMMAIKIIDKDFIFKNAKQSIIQNQKTILQSCSSHPFVTKLYMSFETEHYIVFCMEYCNGGELFNLLRKVKRMKESEAKFYFLQTLSAIQFLHSKGILYRDLKPQNIILDSDGHIRLADYGLSKIINNERTYSFCGSAEYMAPQMLSKKGHSYEIDYYCLGALLYELVTGLPPFYSRDQNQLFDNILTTSLTFPTHTILSDEIKDFLNKMLEKEVQNRFQNIDEIYAHPWVSQNLKKSDILSLQLNPPHPTDMFMYNFDDSEFSHEQKTILRLIEEQKKSDLSCRRFSSSFEYLSDEILQFKQLINKRQLDKFNFYKPKMKLTDYHSRDSSLNVSQNLSQNLSKNSDSLQKRSVEKHYFPQKKSPQKRQAPWIQNEYLKGVKSSGSIHYYHQRNAFSPSSNRFMNIYTSKNNLWNVSNKSKNDSIAKLLEKNKKLSVSLSKKNNNQESFMQKSRSQEKNNFYFDGRRGSDTNLNHSQGYLSNFKDRFNHPKVKKSFRQAQKVNFYFSKNNHR